MAKMPSFILNVTSTPDYVQVFEFEKFDHKSLRFWLKDEGNWTLIIIPSIIYVFCIWLGQKLMHSREAFQVRKYLIFWNVLQATLSAMVFVRMSPELYVQLKERNLYSTFCSYDVFHNIATNFWGSVFCLSKILDFGDTAFLVLAKKPVRFLHWYHHVTVAIYCVFVLDWTDPAIRWFAVVNSAIHFIMYSYYALMAIRIRIPRVLAMSITTIQLAQMLFGIYINVTTFRMILNDIPCNRPIGTIYVSLAMYASYFILFAELFYSMYLAPGTVRTTPKSKLS